MRSIFYSVSAVVCGTLLLAGCQSDRISGIDTGPTPIAPAPAGNVQQTQLPPPSKPAGQMTDPNQFPSAPVTVTTQDPQATPGTAATGPTDAGTQVASNAPDVTIGAVAGVWSVNVAGQSCKVATPQTKYGQGFRAGPLKCPGDMANVNSWNVAGKQLVLYDANGQTVARLYQSATGKFDGQTTGGQPVTFSR
jgi:hypothetical protein